MASKTLKAKAEENWGEPIDMVEFGRKLAARRAELGDPPGTRNSGKRRTASKRALLAEIEKIAARLRASARTRFSRRDAETRRGSGGGLTSRKPVTLNSFQGP